MKFFSSLLILFSITAHAHMLPASSITSFGSKLSKERFTFITRSFQKKFSSYAAQEGSVLEFLTDYEADWAQSFARRWEKDQVLVYGGLAAIPNVTEDAFALVLCHELGHLYGGEPHSEEHNKFSVEGQADFWGASHCFEETLPFLEMRGPSSDSLSLCEGSVSCARGLDAALVLSAFFADTVGLTHPKFNSPDRTVVTHVLKTHPSPQCRLDTFFHGFFNLWRPVCWIPSI